MLALRAEAQRGVAPYHERFGETREMTRLEVALEAELPWVGGWLILCGGEFLETGSAEIECDLRMNDGIVQLRCGGGFDLSATWRLTAASTAGDTPVSFCSPDRESAT